MAEDKRRLVDAERVVRKPHVASVGKQAGYVSVRLRRHFRRRLKGAVGAVEHKARQRHLPVRLVVY